MARHTWDDIETANGIAGWPASRTLPSKSAPNGRERAGRLWQRTIASIRWTRDVVALWCERARQRRALAQLDDRQLRDIGLTRYDAAREAFKPFWR